MSKWWVVILGVFPLAGPSARSAELEPGRGETIFQAGLIRVAEADAARLGVFFSATAADPLNAGWVEVRRKREVEVALDGARPGSDYEVFFCPLGAAPSACLGLGRAQTDRNGDARVRLPFSLPGLTFSGVFVLTRGNANQFVSGWQFATEAAAAVAVEIQLRGEVAWVGASSLRLKGFPLDILVTSSTRFEKVSGLGALKAGDEVEIWGYVRADGAVVATRVKLDEKPDPAPPGHSAAHGR